MFDNKEVRDFINNSTWYVVVSGVVQDCSAKFIDIVCASPIWGNFKISMPNSCGIERGDILEMKRETRTQSDGKQYFEYKFFRNVTKESVVSTKRANAIVHDFKGIIKQKLLSKQQKIKE